MDREEIFNTARLLTEELSEKIETPAPDRLDIWLKRREDLMTAVAGLRVKRLGYLACITGLDPGVEIDHLEVLYHFCPDAAIINLRVMVPKADPSITSLSSIIPSAEPFERELREMFGIEVVGLKNPDYLYLPDNWDSEIYPLRKDFNPEKMVRKIQAG